MTYFVINIWLSKTVWIIWDFIVWTCFTLNMVENVSTFPFLFGCIIIRNHDLFGGLKWGKRSQKQVDGVFSLLLQIWQKLNVVLPICDLNVTVKLFGGCCTCSFLIKHVAAHGWFWMSLWWHLDVAFAVLQHNRSVAEQKGRKDFRNECAVILICDH